MKKKIAFIGIKGIPAIGGAARVAESIIEYLKDEFEITVYAMSSHANKKNKPQGFRQLIIPTIPIRKINIYFYYFFAYLHAIFLAKYDLVHIHLVDSGIFLPLLRIKYKNILGTSHGRGPLIPDKFGKIERLFLRISENLFLKFSTYITVVAQPLIEQYQIMTSKKIEFIPNGVDNNNSIYIDKPFNEICRNKLERKKYILFSAARIIPIKGCHLFLKAIDECNISTRVAIIGDINQIPEYKVEIEKLIKKTNATYIGFIKNKKELMNYISAAKLFVFPSTFEAMSMMLLEVASLKTPIICSKIPENTWIFDDTEVLYFKNNDFHDLSEKISYASNNMKIMEVRAELAYNKLVNNYTWDKISKQYSNIYNNILNDPK